MAFVDGQIVGIPRKSPSTATSDGTAALGNQHILAVEQALAGAGSTGTNMVMELVQKKGIEGATAVHTIIEPTSLGTDSARALESNELRVMATFYNAGTSTVYLAGARSSVTEATTNDLILEPGMVFTDQWTCVEWFCVFDNVDTGNDLRVMEIVLQESDSAQTV